MNVYETKPVRSYLAGNSYVGRGLLMGCSADGTKAAAAYFIMGRSANSRNRVFVRTEDGIRTQAYDPSKLTDPSLIIYAPVRALGSRLIVTNGDQTDTIRDFLLKGGTFAEALETRTFEPDGPNFTPRISALATFSEGGFSYELSILKSADAAGSGCTRHLFQYPALPGVGHFIHTYVCDGNPIPSFQGEPERVQIPNGIDDLTLQIWDNLDTDNRISLYVNYTDLKTGLAETRLVNKNV